MRLFRSPIRSALLGLAALALATPVAAQPLTVQDLPGLFAEARAQQPGGEPLGQERVLRLPIDGSYDREAGMLVLSAAESPFRAVDLNELAPKDGALALVARFIGQGSTAGRTRAEILVCRHDALLAAQRQTCEAGEEALTLGLANPADIALPRRSPLAAARGKAVMASGLVLEIAFRLAGPTAAPADAARMEMTAVLTGLTVVDGAGGVLARGVSSDSLTFDGPPPAYRWLSRPTTDQVNRSYPDRAMRQDVPGRVVLRCKVSHFGWLRACAPVAETPVDYGFGDAAIRLSRGFRMGPAEAGDDLTGRQVNVPVVFMMAGSVPGPPPAPPSPSPSTP